MSGESCGKDAQGDKGVESTIVVPPPTLHSQSQTHITSLPSVPTATDPALSQCELENIVYMGPPCATHPLHPSEEKVGKSEGLQNAFGRDLEETNAPPKGPKTWEGVC